MRRRARRHRVARSARSWRDALAALLSRSTTSSPRRAPGRSVASIIIMSMQTCPPASRAGREQTSMLAGCGGSRPRTDRERGDHLFAAGGSSGAVGDGSSRGRARCEMPVTSSWRLQVASRRTAAPGTAPVSRQPRPRPCRGASWAGSTTPPVRQVAELDGWPASSRASRPFRRTVPSPGRRGRVAQVRVGEVRAEAR